MPLFDVAILEKPSKKEEEEGATEKLVFGPVTQVARDAQSAAIAAVMGRPADAPKIDMQKAQGLVRPFA